MKNKHLIVELINNGEKNYTFPLSLKDLNDVADFSPDSKTKIHINENQEILISLKELDILD